MTHRARAVECEISHSTTSAGHCSPPLASPLRNMISLSSLKLDKLMRACEFVER